MSNENHIIWSNFNLDIEDGWRETYLECAVINDWDDEPDDYEIYEYMAEVNSMHHGVLKARPDDYDAEMIVTRTGLKQYLHSSCWYRMIEERRPYNGKLYM